MYSFVPPFREAKFCGVPSCGFDKSGCAAGKKILRNTALEQRFLTCGPRTPGGPRLFRKLNNFSQQFNKAYIREKSKSEIENFKRSVKVKEF
jgi:hypothetical protein